MRVFPIVQGAEKGADHTTQKVIQITTNDDGVRYEYKPSMTTSELGEICSDNAYV